MIKKICGIVLIIVFTSIGVNHYNTAAEISVIKLLADIFLVISGATYILLEERYEG